MQFSQSGATWKWNGTRWTSRVVESPASLTIADTDFNADGNTDPDDLADYIGAFFTGCG